MALNLLGLNPCVWKEYLSAQEASLPVLPDVTDATSRVIRILGGNPGEMQLQGTNTYLVGTGKSRILIDTGQGIPIWIDNLIKVITDRGLDIAHVLLTHWHGDHTGGIPQLVSFNPCLASKVYKNQPDPGQQQIEHGQIFQVDGATIRAVFSPGHAFDHMCFVLEEENALFTGDNILGHGYSVVEDLGIFMTSLKVMEKQRCTMGYPAHGVPISNLPRKISQEIEHRRARERRIYSTLVNCKKNVSGGEDKGRGGSMSMRELIYAMYGDVPEEMLKMALEPFTIVVLRKLAEDRKVAFRMQAKERRWFVNNRTQI